MESGETSVTPTKPRISLRYIRATSLPFYYFSLRCPRSKTAGNYKFKPSGYRKNMSVHGYQYIPSGLRPLVVYGMVNRELLQGALINKICL